MSAGRIATVDRFGSDPDIPARRKAAERRIAGFAEPARSEPASSPAALFDEGRRGKKLCADLAQRLATIALGAPAGGIIVVVGARVNTRPSCRCRTEPRRRRGLDPGIRSSVVVRGKEIASFRPASQ